MKHKWGGQHSSGWCWHCFWTWNFPLWLFAGGMLYGFLATGSPSAWLGVALVAFLVALMTKFPSW